MVSFPSCTGLHQGARRSAMSANSMRENPPVPRAQPGDSRHSLLSGNGPSNRRRTVGTPLSSSLTPTHLHEYWPVWLTLNAAATRTTPEVYAPTPAPALWPARFAQSAVTTSWPSISRSAASAPAGRARKRCEGDADVIKLLRKSCILLAVASFRIADTGAIRAPDQQRTAHRSQPASPGF